MLFYVNQNLSVMKTFSFPNPMFHINVLHLMHGKFLFVLLIQPKCLIIWLFNPNICWTIWISPGKEIPFSDQLQWKALEWRGMSSERESCCFIPLIINSGFGCTYWQFIFKLHAHLHFCLICRGLFEWNTYCLKYCLTDTSVFKETC